MASRRRQTRKTRTLESELELCRPRAADYLCGQLQGSRSDSEKKRACSPLAANHRKQQSLLSHCQKQLGLSHGVVRVDQGQEEAS